MTKQEAYAELKTLLNSDKRVYVNIVSVSRSGMMRKMKFYSIKNDRMVEITYHIATILGYTRTNDYCLKVTGCGMDMVFSVLSNLNYACEKLDGLPIHNYMDYCINANYYGTV